MVAGAKHKRSIQLLSVAFSLALLSWLILRIDRDAVASVFAKANWAILPWCVGLVALVPFFAGLRWYGILRAQHTIAIPIGVLVRAVMMAAVLNSFLPSKGGDLAKVLYLKDKTNISVGAGTVVAERLLDLFLLGILGIIGAAISGSNWGYAAGLLLSGGSLALVATIVFLPFEKLISQDSKFSKIADKLIDFRSVFKQWVSSPSSVALSTLGSFGNWSVAAGVIALLLVALNFGEHWAFAIGVFPLAVLAGLVPLTVSGIGARDTALVAFLSTQVPSEEATLVALGYTVFCYWLLSLINAPVVAWELVRFFKRKNSTAQESPIDCAASHNISNHS